MYRRYWEKDLYKRHYEYGSEMPFDRCLVGWRDLYPKPDAHPVATYGPDKEPVYRREEMEIALTPKEWLEKGYLISEDAVGQLAYGTKRTFVYLENETVQKHPLKRRKSELPIPSEVLAKPLWEWGFTTISKLNLDQLKEYFNDLKAVHIDDLPHKAKLLYRERIDGVQEQLRNCGRPRV